MHKREVTGYGSLAEFRGMCFTLLVAITCIVAIQGSCMFGECFTRIVRVESGVVRIGPGFVRIESGLVRIESRFVRIGSELVRIGSGFVRTRIHPVHGPKWHRLHSTMPTNGHVYLVTIDW